MKVENEHAISRSKLLNFRLRRILALTKTAAKYYDSKILDEIRTKVVLTKIDHYIKTKHKLSYLFFLKARINLNKVLIYVQTQFTYKKLGYLPLQ